MKTIFETRRRTASRPITRNPRKPQGWRLRNRKPEPFLKTVAQSPGMILNEERAKALLGREILFIHNRLFSERASAEAFGHALDKLTGLAAAVPEVDSTTARGRLDRLYQAPHLKLELERRLCCDLSYVKFCVNFLRGLLLRERPDGSVVEQLERLLTQAIAIRNWIECANPRLVASIARRFASEQYCFDQLFGDGNSTLLKAVEIFDFSRALSKERGRQLQKHAIETLRQAAAEWSTD